MDGSLLKVFGLTQGGTWNPFWLETVGGVDDLGRSLKQPGLWLRYQNGQVILTGKERADQNSRLDNNGLTD